MSSWAERVHRRAADFGSVVTSCGHPGSSAPAYPYRLEKVKFGVPLEEVCKSNDNIPGPLLVLILKLNKESPNRRDVFRAPGHQGAMKKLIHFLQAGRLVNVDNYSVYTIASVLKKFLRKIPNGIFGRTGEKELFAIIELENEVEQNDRLHRLFTSLPKYTQHLLVLLFGTFRVIASNAAHAGTGMTSEALGVSVAPSFFQSCVSDGKTARMEDVLKFKVATKIMKHIIDKFATQDLFGRDNYEYYARVTGRILKVQDEWICSFQYPPPPRGKLAQQKYALQHSLEAEKTWLQCQCERWGLLAQEESRSTPALLTSSSSALENSVLSLGVTPEHSFMESCARLSVSLEGPGLFAMTSSPLPKRVGAGGEPAEQRQRINTDDLERLHRYDDVDGNDGDAEADDDDEDDEDDIDGDFAAELEMIHDDDMENNPRMQNLFKTGRARQQHPSRSAGAASITTASSSMSSGRGTSVAAGAGGAAGDDDDDDDDELTFVKRRYRQNRQKITQTRMQTRRLRACSKSLDGGAPRGGKNATDAVADLGGKTAANATTATAMTTAAASSSTAPVGGKKTRTCSRCNRGIRHSSSCSSASASGCGGGVGSGGNGSMTLEELRAVNRYAESTKSLSYLPQVHERQTARMRTRSEWFLGPRRDGGGCGLMVGGLQLPGSTCSNCCLAAQQHQQQQHTYYLGGGSTRDMRSRRNKFEDDDEDDDDNNNNGEDCAVALRNGGGRDALYRFYKQQQQQQQQQQTWTRGGDAHQQQRPHSHTLDTTAHYMDTDDSSADYRHQHQHQQQERDGETLPRAPPAPHMSHSTSPVPAAAATAALATMTTTTAFLTPHAAAAAQGDTGRRLFLDPKDVGNIRLSNSAESIQYPARRPPPSARRLIGINVPRQYPLRSSLRRNKAKLVGSGSTVGSAGSAGGGINALLDSGCSIGGGSSSNQLSSVRNSIAECCANIGARHGGGGGGSGSNILTPISLAAYNRLETRSTTSLDQKVPLKRLAATPASAFAFERDGDGAAGGNNDVAQMLVDEPAHHDAGGGQTQHGGDVITFKVPPRI